MGRIVNFINEVFLFNSILFKLGEQHAWIVKIERRTEIKKKKLKQRKHPPPLAHVS